MVPHRLFARPARSLSAAPSALALLALALLALGPAGCGARGLRAEIGAALERGEIDAALDAYDRHREREGDDLGALRAIAARLLELEARQDEPSRRRAAFSQLSISGDGGAEVLERLSREGVPTPVRVEALAVRARRGDAGARRALRPFLDADEQAYVAAAALALDAGSSDDRARLVALLEHPSADARTQAARALRGAAPDGSVRLALANAARRDPHPPARAAAVRSLAAWKVEAVDVLRERLSDPEPSVRLAAVAALGEADRPSAAATLVSFFDGPPGAEGVEAARVLLRTAPEGLSDEVSLDARTYLRGALQVGSPGVRGQAGVALASLGRSEPELEDAVAQALEAEEVPSVRLSLAAALFGSERYGAQGREALVALLDADAGNATVQAASLLSRRSPGAERPLGVLEAALSGADALARRVAARALSVDAHRPDLAAAALRDGDPDVRVAAAGGILAAR